mmetsp:Transcript_6678/g.12606  ORF Transcript_6678/g.12606 Transcript_6678/m.12606 type:complete len:252 (-) Transcript_6678:330-1085(-)
MNSCSEPEPSLSNPPEHIYQAPPSTKLYEATALRTSSKLKARPVGRFGLTAGSAEWTQSAEKAHPVQVPLLVQESNCSTNEPLISVFAVERGKADTLLSCPVRSTIIATLITVNPNPSLRLKLAPRGTCSWIIILLLLTEGIHFSSIWHLIGPNTALSTLRPLPPAITKMLEPSGKAHNEMLTRLLTSLRFVPARLPNLRRFSHTILPSTSLNCLLRRLKDLGLHVLETAPTLTFGPPPRSYTPTSSSSLN